MARTVRTIAATVLIVLGLMLVSAMLSRKDADGAVPPPPSFFGAAVKNHRVDVSLMPPVVPMYGPDGKVIGRILNPLLVQPKTSLLRHMTPRYPY